jgi:hypothetical protein
MNFVEWSKSSVDYGRKLMNSALEGARSGEDEFLDREEEALAPYLSDSARQALGPAAVGAYLGLVGGCLGSLRRSTGKVLACALLGGAIGFAAGMLWDSRRFTRSVASGAWRSLNKTRDHHWLEKHPIDYA